jgi:hypothetical protein
MSLIRGDRETFLANNRALTELSALRCTRTVLATAGDRLVLEHLLRTSDGSEAEVLQVVEVDTEGRSFALIAFDPDDRRAGAGRLSAAEYVGFLGALFQQSLDAIIEPLYYLAMERHAFLAIAHNSGTLADGGASESAFVQLGGDSGVELFEVDDLDAARALRRAALQAGIVLRSRRIHRRGRPIHDLASFRLLRDLAVTRVSTRGSPKDAL